jgi:ESCRT-I complex subunit TSG101
MNINVSANVDSTGRIYLPALTDWRYPNSDLYMLLNLMTIKFSEQTPLYTKPSQSGANPIGRVQAYPPIPAVNNDQRSPYPISGGMAMPMPNLGGYGGMDPNSSNIPPSYASTPYYPAVTAVPQPQQLSHLKSNSNSNIGQTRSSYADDTIKPEHFRMSLVSAVQDRVRLKYKELTEDKVAEIDSLKKVALFLSILSIKWVQGKTKQPNETK